jgi:hypothetical protein
LHLSHTNDECAWFGVDSLLDPAKKFLQTGVREIASCDCLLAQDVVEETMRVIVTARLMAVGALAFVAAPINAPAQSLDGIAVGGGGGGGGGVAQIIAALNAGTEGPGQAGAEALVSAQGGGLGEGGGLSNIGISFGDSLLFLGLGAGRGGGGGGGITEVLTSVFASSEEGGAASAESLIFTFAGGSGFGEGGGFANISTDGSPLFSPESLQAQFDGMEIHDLSEEFNIPLLIGFSNQTNEVSPD